MRVLAAAGEGDRAVRRDDRVPGHRRRRARAGAAARADDGRLAVGRGHRRAVRRSTGAWHRRCRSARIATRCTPTPTCRCPGSPGWSRSSSTASICTTSPWSATTPAGRSSSCSSRDGAARVGRIVLASCDAFDNFPPGPDRQDAGADRQTPARDVRAVHAADAAAAGPAAPARVRLADQARGRRHRPLDEAGPGRSPRSAATPSGCCGRRPRTPASCSTAAERLPGFDRPALVVWASEDRVMPPEHGRRLAELLPHGRLVEIADSYTLIPLDQPARLAQAIREFTTFRPGLERDWLRRPGPRPGATPPVPRWPGRPGRAVKEPGRRAALALDSGGLGGESSGRIRGQGRARTGACPRRSGGGGDVSLSPWSQALGQDSGSL